MIADQKKKKIMINVLCYFVGVVYIRFSQVVNSTFCTHSPHVEGLIIPHTKCIGYVFLMN